MRWKIIELAGSSTRLRTASFELGSSVSVSQSLSASDLARFTVDGLARRSPEAVRGQNLHEAGLFPQAFHPFMVSAVGKELDPLGVLFSVQRAGRVEDGHVLHLIVPWDSLAVQPRADSEREHHSKGEIGDQEGFIIASKSDHMGGHTEHWIVVHKEGIGLPASKSVSLHKRESVSTHGHFRFCRDLVFFKRSWRVRAISPVFLSRNTNRSISP